MSKYRYTMTFRVNADEDGYTIGFHRLRDCTTREAKHILIGIFGFVMPQYDEMFGHDHAILRFNTEVIKDVHAFLDGEVDEVYLYEKYAKDYCENSFTPFDMFVLAEYLQRKGII